MLHLLRSSHPLSSLVIPITALVMWSVQALVMGPAQPLPLTDAWLPASLLWPGGSALHYGLIAVNALLINRLFKSHELAGSRSNLCGFFYVVLVGSAPVYEVVNPVLAGSLFFIAGLNRTLNVYRQNDAGGDYFDAGFLFGLSALFCHGFAVSLLLLVASVFYTRAANWREVSLPVVGFILPPSIFLVVLWLANLPLFEMHLGTASETPIGAHVLSYMLAVVGIAAITGIFGMLKTYGSSGNKAKNSRAVLLIFSIGVSATAGWVFAYEPETAYGLVMLTASWLLPWPFTGRSNRWVSLMAMALIIILMLGWLARIELF